MKRKLWLPCLLILMGIVIAGIGIKQITDTKIQTAKALNQAKRLVEHSSKATPLTTEKNKRTKGKPMIPGDTLGLLLIPKINAELPIVEGTNDNDLAKGVGHFKGSFMPGDNGQIVLSGHRDTVFRHVGELKIGDTLIVQLPNGSFKYKINHTKIVKSNDTSIITLQHSHEELILTTCYPFRYIGNAPKRYIIYAYPQ